MNIVNTIGHYRKGNIPWNKGKKGLHLSAKTEFKVGKCGGPKSKAWKGGIQVTKKDCAYVWKKGYNKRNRIRRPYLVIGKPKKGYVVYHLDGNRNNDSKDNLIIISRAELLRRNLLFFRQEK